MPPSRFVLFHVSAIDNIQVALANGDTEQELIRYIDNRCPESTDYFCIYRYRSDEFFFGSTQKALKYQHVKTIRGKKNSGAFPFSAMEYALLFDNEYGWFYQSH